MQASPTGSARYDGAMAHVRGATVPAAASDTAVVNSFPGLRGSSVPVEGTCDGESSTCTAGVSTRAAGGGVAEETAASLTAFPDVDADGNPDLAGPFGGS